MDRLLALRKALCSGLKGPVRAGRCASCGRSLKRASGGARSETECPRSGIRAGKLAASRHRSDDPSGLEADRVKAKSLAPSDLAHRRDAQPPLGQASGATSVMSSEGFEAVLRAPTRTEFLFSPGVLYVGNLSWPSNVPGAPPANALCIQC